MKMTTNVIPTTAAASPFRIESRPREGPMLRSSRRPMLAGSEPARSTMASFSASCRLPIPVMTPLSKIRDSMTGADWSW